MFLKYRQYVLHSFIVNFILNFYLIGNLSPETVSDRSFLQLTNFQLNQISKYQPPAPIYFWIKL